MKPKTMILLVVALTCGLGASYMTSKLLAERKGPPPEERVTVLIAKVKVPKHTVLKEPEKFFEARSLPRSTAPKVFFSDFKEVKDKRVNKEFKPDVHIAPEDVADKMSGLPIPDGFGAIGVKITATSAVGYFVAPADRVDVILTQRGEGANSATILRDMLVLSVGEWTTRPGEQQNTIQAQTVTMAVKPDEAQLLRLAETQGDLSLLLRKEGDTTEWKSDKVTTTADLKRWKRGLDQTGPLTTPPADPNKLPFGLDLDKIEKTKPVEDKEPEPEPEPIKPEWTVTIAPGFAAPIVVPFYKRPDGTVSRDVNPALDARKDRKKAGQ